MRHSGMQTESEVSCVKWRGSHKTKQFVCRLSPPKSSIFIPFAQRTTIESISSQKDPKKAAGRRVKFFFFGHHTVVLSLALNAIVWTIKATLQLPMSLAYIFPFSVLSGGRKMKSAIVGAKCSTISLPQNRRETGITTVSKHDERSPRHVKMAGQEKGG